MQTHYPIHSVSHPETKERNLYSFLYYYFFSPFFFNFFLIFFLFLCILLFYRARLYATGRNEMRKHCDNNYNNNISRLTIQKQKKSYLDKVVLR